MRPYLYLALLLIACPGASWAQNPLTEPEKREILERLIELKGARQIIAQQERTIAALEALALERQRLTEDRIKFEIEKHELTRKELALIQERATFYETAWKAALAKPSKTCRIFSGFFTLGLYRCKPVAYKGAGIGP